ncbi:MAG: alpha/beta hydrolase [Verrucomicrobiales bacterium]|nr:alpha/beta hydrolase [Verrucomicrobiales bacterium]
MIKHILVLLFAFQSAFAASPEKLAELLKKFPDADTNGDAVLTEEEALAYRAARKVGTDRAGKKSTRQEPTHADVSYGDDEKNRFDLWVPEKEESDPRNFPVLVYFHGGGFVGGDKSQFDPGSYLDAGIACASVNYRLVDGDTVTSPTPMIDSARALQTIRHHALEWGLDPGRIALSGGSAGAVIALWLGYHNDLADPEAEDPIARESTRVTALIPLNAPTNLMPDWIVKNIGGGKDVHGSFPKLFGEPVTHPLNGSLKAKVAEISPWEFVSEDDPPTYLVYSGPLDETPLPGTATTGKVIHHPAFGKALKEKLDTLGIENEFRYGFDPRGKPNLAEYLMTQFGMLE